MSVKGKGRVIPRCEECGWKGPKIPVTRLWQIRPAVRVANVFYVLHFFGARHTAKEWGR